MPINATWHHANPMPHNPSPEQRLVWHRAHARACNCRPMPAGMMAKLDAEVRARRTRPTRRKLAAAATTARPRHPPGR